jgi:Tfp pilus assembly protein PilO
MSKVIAPFLLLVASIGLIFSYVQPAWETLNTFQELELRLENAVRQTEQMLSTLTTLQNKYESFPPEEVRRLNQLLPDDVDAVRLIIDIDTIAEEHGLTIDNFAVPYINTKELTTEENVVESAVMSISAKGSYASFKDFLFDIESSLTLLDVVNLNVHSGVPDYITGGIVPSYKIDLQTYWFK